MMKHGPTLLESKVELVVWVGAMVTTGGLEEVGTTRGEGPRWYLDGVEAELRVVLAGEVLGEISSGPVQEKR